LYQKLAADTRIHIMALPVQAHPCDGEEEDEMTGPKTMSNTLTMRRHEHGGVKAQMTTRSTPLRRRGLLAAAMKGFWWMGEERSVGVCVPEDGGVCSGCVCASPRAPPPLCSKEDDIYIGEG
jgi:hypothetical protein